MEAHYKILDDALWHQLCHGSGHRHYSRISVRHQLVKLLLDGRRHLRPLTCGHEHFCLFSCTRLLGSNALWLGAYF